jgi:hypothetical protein
MDKFLVVNIIFLNDQELKVQTLIIKMCNAPFFFFSLFSVFTTIFKLINTSILTYFINKQKKKKEYAIKKKATNELKFT